MDRFQSGMHNGVIFFINEPPSNNAFGVLKDRKFKISKGSDQN